MHLTKEIGRQRYQTTIKMREIITRVHHGFSGLLVAFAFPEKGG